MLIRVCQYGSYSVVTNIFKKVLGFDVAPSSSLGARLFCILHLSYSRPFVVKNKKVGFGWIYLDLLGFGQT
jgi:hypothetical protein